MAYRQFARPSPPREGVAPRGYGSYTIQETRDRGPHSAPVNDRSTEAVTRACSRLLNGMCQVRLVVSE